MLPVLDELRRSPGTWKAIRAPWFLLVLFVSPLIWPFRTRWMCSITPGGATPVGLPCPVKVGCWSCVMRWQVLLSTRPAPCVLRNPVGTMCCFPLQVAALYLLILAAALLSDVPALGLIYATYPGHLLFFPADWDYLTSIPSPVWL